MTTLMTYEMTNSKLDQETTDPVHLLIAKLDEGTRAVMNLRSILTLKMAELNELLAQLELTNQAIITVENTTSQIEHMLQVGLDSSALLSAEASLDSAIKIATSIQLKKTRRTSTSSNGSPVEEKRYSHARLSTSRIRYKPDSKPILRKLNDLVKDLGLDSAQFFSTLGTTDDFQVLQKAYVDLDIAKTISLSAKSYMKRRNILMKSARRRNNLDEIHALGDKIREGVSLWTTYTKNAPLLINGEDIIKILDREDEQLSKSLSPPSSRGSIHMTASISTHTSSRHSSSHKHEPMPDLSKRHSRRLSVTEFSFNKTSPPLSPAATSVDTTKKRSSVSARSPPETTKKSIYRFSAGSPTVAPVETTKKSIYRLSADVGPVETAKKSIYRSSVGSPSVGPVETTKKSIYRSSVGSPSVGPVVTKAPRRASVSVHPPVPNLPEEVKKTTVRMNRRKSISVAGRVPKDDLSHIPLPSPPQSQKGPILKLKSALLKRT